jgi:hypothetical protein
MAAGERLRFEPPAIIYYPMLQERLRMDYFLSWWYGFGRALVLERGTRRAIIGSLHKFISIPSLVVRSLPLRSLRWLLARNPHAVSTTSVGSGGRQGRLSRLTSSA